MYSFRISSIVVRSLMVYGLLFAIYNPSGYSYFHWITDWSGEVSLLSWAVYLLLKLSIGIVLFIISWTIVSVVYHGVGRIGMVLLSLLTLTTTPIIWMLWRDSWGVQVVLLIGVGLFFSIGVVYSNLRYRFSAQVQPASANPSAPGF